MNHAKDGRLSVFGRFFAAALLLAVGVAAALPFRNQERAKPVRTKTSSDSVRLVFRNQDITLQVSPRVEESPASPAPAPFPYDLASPADPHAVPPLDASPAVPDLPSQYRSLLDPNSTAPSASHASFEFAFGRTTTVPTTPRVVAAPSLPAHREHIIADGDTLSRLAERYLGDASRAAEIKALNPNVLADSNILPIGKLIRIPSRRTVAESSVNDVRPASVSRVVREPQP